MKKSPCLCGEEYHFKDCPYLIESKCLNNWKADLDVKKKIQDKIQASKRLDGIIKSIQQKQSKDDTDAGNSRDLPALFATITSIPYIDQSDYILQNSFIGHCDFLGFRYVFHICHLHRPFQSHHISALHQCQIIFDWQSERQLILKIW